MRLEFILYLNEFQSRLPRRTEVLPLNSLCIAKGKAVWVLYVDAICINYDGNAFDAALLAIVAALQNGKVASPTRARRGTDQV